VYAMIYAYKSKVCFKNPYVPLTWCITGVVYKSKEAVVVVIVW